MCGETADGFPVPQAAGILEKGGQPQLRGAGTGILRHLEPRQAGAGREIAHYVPPPCPAIAKGDGGRFDFSQKKGEK